MYSAIQPVQRIFRLREHEQSIDSIEDISHGDLGVVVPVEYVVTDASHTVNVAVVHLVQVKKMQLCALVTVISIQPFASLHNSNARVNGGNVCFCKSVIVRKPYRSGPHSTLHGCKLRQQAVYVAYIVTLYNQSEGQQTSQ